jgi:hypothetical protein
MKTTIEEKLNETKEHFIERFCIEFKCNAKFLETYFNLTKDPDFGWTVKIKQEWTA